MRSTATTTTAAGPIQSNDPCWCGSGRKYKRCHKPLEGRVLPGDVSPMRTWPTHLERPPYADSGVVRRITEPRVKSPEIIERMRVACRLGAEILQLAGAHIEVGFGLGNVFFPGLEHGGILGRLGIADVEGCFDGVAPGDA